MDTVKTRILRLTKIIRVVCIIARVALAIMLVASLAQLVFICIHPDKAGFIVNLLGGEDLLESLSDSDLPFTLTPPLLKGIPLGVGMVQAIVMWILFGKLKAVLTHIIANGQPFTLDTARHIRRTSYAMLLMIFNDPVLGITLFLVMLFISNVFEYGSYLQEKADKTNRIQEEVIVSLAEITENKSEQTGQHIRRVSEYSRILGRQMGLSEEQAQNLRLASTMHDLGKLMIPAEILEKPARLTDEEFAVIKKHPGYGEHLLHNVEGDTMTLARTIALEHHERYDGKGYPNGEKGEEISLEGRIVAVADVYDALTSRRSYKEAWDPRRAYDEIVRGSGTQFDANVVEAFKAAYAEIDAARRKYADEAFNGRIA